MESIHRGKDLDETYEDWCYANNLPAISILKQNDGQYTVYFDIEPVAGDLVEAISFSQQRHIYSLICKYDRGGFNIWSGEVGDIPKEAEAEIVAKQIQTILADEFVDMEADECRTNDLEDYYAPDWYLNS